MKQKMPQIRRIFITVGLGLSLVLMWLFISSHIIDACPDNVITVCENGCDYVAIQAAIDAAFPESIVLISAGVYTENIVIDKSIALHGGTVVLDGNGDVTGQRSVTVYPGSVVTISGLFITNGRTAPGVMGGGILNWGTLTLNNVTVAGNATGAGQINRDGGFGGGIYNVGTLILNYSIVSHNSTGDGGGSSDGTPVGDDFAGDGGFGGGIYNTGVLLLNNSSVNNNRTGKGGDAVFSGFSGFGGFGGGIGNTGTLILNNTAIHNNLTGDGGKGRDDDVGGTGGGGGSGGGISNGGLLTLDHSSISANRTGCGGQGGLSSPTQPGAAAGGDGGEGGLGGGIYNHDVLTITNSLIISNSNGQGGDSGAGSGTALGGRGGVGGRGGGIANAGTLTIGNTTIKGNNTGNGGNGGDSFVIAGNGGDGGQGGGLYHIGALLTLDGNLIGANSTGHGGAGGSSNDGSHGAKGIDGAGGGMFDHGFRLFITNSTISGNAATGDGGGTFHAINTLVNVNNSTIANNTADSNHDNSGSGGGVYISGRVFFQNTIIADNADWLGNYDCGMKNGVVTSQGYNLVENSFTCDFFPPDIIGVDPLLEPLADNGGDTKTHALQRNSPAIDAGNPSTSGSDSSACDHDDQRGDARPIDGDGDEIAVCDIGAYEAPAKLIIHKSGPTIAIAGDFITYTLAVTNNDSVTATDLMITDAIPSSASFVSGGTLAGNVVRWTIDDLMSAEQAYVSFVVTATQTITNSDYHVRTGNNIRARGNVVVVTEIIPRIEKSIRFSAVDYIVDEAMNEATITVTLDFSYPVTITIDYTTSDGSAVSESDYMPISGTLTFVPGITSQTFTVPIVNDALDEMDEMVVLTLNNLANATLCIPITTILIIKDDDPQPMIGFSKRAYYVDENANIATITVALDVASGIMVKVNYTTMDGTALAGRDYITATGVLTFTPGITLQTFTVLILDDELDEPNKTISLTLGSPVNGILNSFSFAILSILDDDEPTLVYLPLVLRDCCRVCSSDDP